MTRRYAMRVLSNFLFVQVCFQEIAFAADSPRFSAVPLCSILTSPARYHNAFVETEGVIAIGRELFALRPIEKCARSKNIVSEDVPAGLWLAYGDYRTGIGDFWLIKEPLPESILRLQEVAKNSGLNVTLSVRIRGKIESRNSSQKGVTRGVRREYLGYGHLNRYSAQLLLGYAVKWNLTLLPP
jgi:hypothetical protein